MLYTKRLRTLKLIFVSTVDFETIPGDRGGRDPNQIPELAIVLALVPDTRARASFSVSSGIWRGRIILSCGRGHQNRGTSRKILKTLFQLICPAEDYTLTMSLAGHMS